MRSWLCITVLVCSVCLLASPVLAQTQDYLDATKVDSQYHKLEFENDQVRVVRFVIPPGGKTAQHDHPDSVIVVLTNYDGRITAPDGKVTDSHGKAGSAAWRNAVRHVFENTGATNAEGILVEPKRSGTLAGMKQDFAKIDPQHVTVDFENDRVRIVHYRYAAGDKIPLHDHPTNVQIFVTDHNLRVTTNGKTTEAHGKAGQAFWREPVTHEAANIGDQTVEGYHIDIKGTAAGKAAGK